MVWDRWSRPDGELLSFAILTCGPNRVIATLHDRMPVFLEPESYECSLHRNADVVRVQNSAQP